MSETDADGGNPAAAGPERVHASIRSERILSLAAAPTFAIMAILTAAPGGGPTDRLCLAAQELSPLSGMVAMYALMSAFHLAPWLKLVSRRRSRARQP